MPDQFRTYISQPSLDFCPGGSPAKFWVAVQNNSSGYASFQLNLKAAGAEETNSPTWYRLVTADSYTIPPKDCIKFKVEILSLPPDREGFVGILCLQAHIYSPELNDADCQILKLAVTGLPPELALHEDPFKANPDTQVQIAVDVKNPNDQPISMALHLNGLPPTWLVRDQVDIILAPKDIQTITFPCQIPAASASPQGLYPFAVEVLQANTTTDSSIANLEVLPGGQVELACEPPHQQVPATPGRWLNRHRKPATYKLTYCNQSNTAVQGDIAIQENTSNSFWRKIFPRQTKIHQIEHVPERINLPLNADRATQINIKYSPPWLGWGCYKEFQFQEYQLNSSVEAPVDVHNQTPTLSLDILPVIPRWLQGVGIISLILLIWALLLQGHQATIKHVEFPHQISLESDLQNNLSAHNVVSGAQNGTLLAWPLRDNFLWLIGQNHLNPFNPPERKAIEVVRYSPDNTKIAVGFKNGEIEIYDWEYKKFQRLLWDEVKADNQDPCYAEERFIDSPRIYKSDRVYDLEFSPDGDVLYSAHGSGRILKWQLFDQSVTVECLQARYISGVQNNTVAAITLVEQDGEPFLAAAGQRNHLTLINLENLDSRQQIFPQKDPVPSDKNSDGRSAIETIRPVNKDDHIRSLTSPAGAPSLLAMGDDQGNITLIDLDTCSGDFTTCDIFDSWSGHGGEPVRSVAFSDNGHYLASAGDDGQVKLWFLDPTNGLRRIPGEGDIIRTSRQRLSWQPFQPRRLETVDLWQTHQGNHLFIVSGGEDQQVRLQKRRITPSQN